MRKTNVLYHTCFLLFLVCLNIYPQGKIAYIDSLSDLSFVPSAGETNTINIYVIDRANIKIQVFNQSNRIVYEFPIYLDVREGMKQYKWDGKDSNGKIVPPGVYKYVVTFSDIKNTYSYAEESYVSVSEYSISDIPPVVEKIISEEEVILPLKIDLKGTSYTQTDSTAEKTRGVSVYERLSLQFKLNYLEKVKTNLDLDLQSAPITGSESVYMDNVSIDYTNDKFNTGVFYRKYLGFYNTPLRLFSSYKVARDKQGVYFEGKYKNTYGQIIRHNAIVNNIGEDGIMLRVEQKLMKYLNFGFSSVNQQRNNGSNRVLGIDTNLTLNRIILKIEGAQSEDTQLQKKGNAFRIETTIPISLFKFGLNYQDIGQEFISYYSDIPHGSDSKGYEVYFGFTTNAEKTGQLFGMNLGLENFNNHFENAPTRSINSNFKIDFNKNLNTLIAYTVTESSSNVGVFKTNSSFINIRHKITQKFDASYFVTVLKSDTYENNSVRITPNYFINENQKIVGEIQVSQRKLILNTGNQNYDINSVMVGYERPFLKKFTVYGHMRISQEKSVKDRTLNSGYLSCKYTIMENFYILGSYGSYIDPENQDRLFIQAKINF